MPLQYTGPDDILAQKIAIIKDAVPRDIASSDRGSVGDGVGDEIRAMAEMGLLGEAVGSEYTRQAHMGTSSGLFTDQHAKDRGLRRQGGETDTMLKQRLANPPQAVTYSAILAAVQAVVDANGGGTAYILQLPANGFSWGSGYFAWGRGWRWSPKRMVVALIPAACVAALTSVLDALRVKVSVGTQYMAQTYT